MRKYLLPLLAFTLFCSSVQVYGQSKIDDTAIRNLLTEFLDKVGSKEMHDRFWHESLVYTSSSGERFGKVKIMSGFNDDTTPSEEPSPYSAEDIDIRVLGEAAILNFTLVNKPKNEEPTYYLNSGVLLRINGEWKVVNWHATSSNYKSN